MKTKLFLFAALATLLFASCDPNTPTTTTPTDPRDKFVGEYSFVATGNVNVNLTITEWNIPLNESGTFEITKAEAENEVLITGYGATINAVVSDNQLILESTTSEMEYSGATVQLTFTHGRATLTDSQLTWSTTVTAIVTYNSLTASGNGQISMIADKNGVD